MNVMTVIIALATSIGGMIIGWWMARQKQVSVLAAAHRQGHEYVEQTLAATGQIKKDAAQSQQAALDQSRQELERTLTELRNEVSRREQRCVHQEQRHQKQSGELQRRADVIAEREKQLATAQKSEQSTQQQIKQCLLEGQKVLYTLVGKNAEQLKGELIESWVDEARSQGADRLRNLEGTIGEEATRKAKRVMAIAMQRYTGHCIRDRSSMTMALNPGEAEQLQGALAGALAMVSQQTSVNFSFGDNTESVRLESGDGVARELCRRVLGRLLNDRATVDVSRVIANEEKNLRDELFETGKKAFRYLSLKPADPEIVDLVGKLNFRTSYTQNQWRHAIEASWVAGLMAAELGLDVKIARRGALMHDIGKALTHEMDGSHALIGAEIARRTGEDERVANAIGYHHGEEPLGSAYAPIVAAADAMSGGRPGARREVVETYSDRIGDLEKVATSFGGVMSVHAAQSGRELRIHVDENRIKDTQLERLSGDIARKISEELVFPGQIRVTVIREFKAVEYAS